MVRPSTFRRFTRPGFRSVSRHWDWAVLTVLVLLGLRGWLRSGYLASTRLEMVPELSIIWMARQRILEGGLLTEWAPYEFAGFPLVRFLSYPLYDGLALLSILTGASLEHLFKAGFLLAYVFSALALYEYAHELTKSRAASVVAGLAYAIFPFHLHAASEAWVHALFWALLPLPFLLYERSRKAPTLRVRDALVLGLLLGFLPIVNSEHALLLIPFLGAYILLRDGRVLLTHRNTWRALLVFWLRTGLVALGVSAFFVLPAVMELKYVGIQLKHGGESFQSDELLRGYAVSPALVWRAIAGRFGAHYTLDPMPVIGSAFWSIAWYPGLVGTAFALLGVWHGRRETLLHVLLICLLLAALFVMGEWLEWNPFPRLPFLGRLAAFRSMIFVAFFGSLCMAWGVRWLLRQRWWQLPRWVPAAMALALIFSDYWPATKALTTVLSYLPEDEIAAYRWMSARGNTASEESGFRSWERVEAHRDGYLRSYALQFDGARHLWGYYDNGAPRHMWALYSWGDVPTALTLGSTRYMIKRSGKETAPSAAAVAEMFPTKVWESESLTIWENPKWRPFVQVYEQSAFYLGDPEYRALDILPALVAHGVALVAGPADYADDYAVAQIAHFDRLIVREPWYRDAAKGAVFEKAMQGRITPHAQVESAIPLWTVGRDEPKPATASWQRPEPEQIEISVELAESALVMVSEAWYPNWRVYIDNQKQPVWRVNYAFLGAWVEAGKHRLIFRYEKPWYVWLGYVISGATLLMLAACAAGNAVSALSRRHSTQERA